MRLTRFLLSAVATTVGAYTVYAVVVAISRETNVLWVAFVGALMAAFCLLLLRAAAAGSQAAVPVRAQLAWIWVVGVGVGARAFSVYGLAGAVVGVIVGGLIGACALRVDREARTGRIASSKN